MYLFRFNQFDFFTTFCQICDFSSSPKLQGNRLLTSQPYWEFVHFCKLNSPSFQVLTVSDIQKSSGHHSSNQSINLIINMCNPVIFNKLYPILKIFILHPLEDSRLSFVIVYVNLSSSSYPPPPISFLKLWEWEKFCQIQIVCLKLRNSEAKSGCAPLIN